MQLVLACSVTDEAMETDPVSMISDSPDAQESFFFFFTYLSSSPPSLRTIFRRENTVPNISLASSSAVRL